ncbi:MAG TPA: triple tyrosine motif-containing protein, partial [bacterium]|nr:triple tyrosine motif-containing protein [bacterium]
GGILQFDGQTWRKITLKDQRNVYSLAVDDTGAIWVGSFGDWGFLKADTSGLMQYHSLAEAFGDSSNKIRQVWRTAVYNGEVFFGSLEGVIRFAKGKLQWIRPTQSFHYMLPTARALWIKDKGVGLMRWDTESQAFVNAHGGDFFKSGIVVAMVSFEPHEYWVVTADDGIYTYNDSTGVVDKLKTSIPLERLKLANAVRMKNEDIFVTSVLQGIFVITRDGRIRMHVDGDDGRGLSDTKFAFESRDGSLWFGHNNGLSVSDFYNPITYIRNEKGINGAVTGVMSIGNKIFAGTTQGVWESEQDGKTPNILKFHKIKGTDFPVYGIDTMYTRIVIYGGDFAILDANGKKLFHTWEFGSRTVVKLPLSENKILAAHRHQLYLIDVKTFSIKQIHRFDDEVVAILLDSVAGNDAVNYWFSYRNRSVRYIRIGRDGAVSVVAAKNIGGLNNYSNLMNLGGRIVLNNDEGLYRLSFDQNSKTINTEWDSVINRCRGVGDINHIIFRNNEYWISKGFRFYKLIKPAQESWRLDSTVVVPGDPIYIDAQDSLSWFGGTEAITRWDHRVGRNYKQVFPTLLRRIILNDDSLFWNGSRADQSNTQNETIIPYAFNSLMLYFSASHYHDISALRFSWKMEGFTDEWTDWSEESRAIYTNLNEGEYTFRVRAKNIYGVVGGETSYRFRVLPPWYRTWWFRVMVLSVIAFILWRVYLYRVHRLLAVERLRVKIASDLHDDIGSNLSKIAMYTELVQETEDPKEAKPMLKTIGDLSRNVISSMSDIVWSIDARNDRVTDLNLRMQNFAHDLLDRKNITVKFESEGIDEDITLPVLVKQNVYLIFKEAVNNIYKY